jgi:hypothetical protein
MNTNAFDESKRLTKILFNEVYAKTFSGRNEFEEFVISIIKQNKLEGGVYTFSSLYLYKNYTFHVNVVYAGCFSPTTFIFNMIWNDEGFKCTCNMDNIATYLGTPAYWFSSKESRTGSNFVDERTIEL